MTRVSGHSRPPRVIYDHLQASEFTWADRGPSCSSLWISLEKEIIMNKLCKNCNNLWYGNKDVVTLRSVFCYGCYISCQFLVKGPLNECNRAYKGNRHKIEKSKFSSAVGSGLIWIPHRFQYRGSNNGSINVAETGIRLVHLVETFFAHFAIFSNKAGRTVVYHQTVGYNS